MDIKSRFAGAMMGLAIGDAYGTTFKQRAKYSISEKELCVDDFSGGGPFNLMKGMFTDATTLALIVGECLLDFTFDPKLVKADDRELMSRLQNLFANDSDLDEMSELNTCIRGKNIQKRLFEWYDKGHFSSNGLCFHMERTTKEYIVKNHKLKRAFCNSLEINENTGRSCVLTRVAPVVLYFYGVYLKKCKENKIKSDYENAIALHRTIQESGFSSLLTHPSQIAIDCNRYMAALIIGALQNATKEELLQPMFVPNYLPKDYWKKFPLREEVLKVVRDCSYKTKSEKEIKNSGFSVAAFEAALWAFFNHGNLMDGLFNIARLGDDSDTVAAIYGQVAGAYYGIDAIPQNFVRKCTFSSLLHVMAGELLAAPDSSNSFAYENLMRLFDEMEAKYEKINRKISPSPNQFASMDDYQQAVSKFENSVNELISNRVNGEMIKGYQIDVEGVNRFKDAAEKLLNDFIKRAEFASKSLRAQLNAVTAKKDLLDSIRK